MKKKSCFYFFALTHFFLLSLQAWDGFNLLDIAAEARVAYYHPSSSKVRRIYGSGWADYQFELSKGLGCNWKIWTGVSGFSRNGRSRDCHDRTRLQLVPVYLGVKYEFPISCDLNFFLGGAACYSFLRIRDHSNYVHEHTHKNDWGGLVQSGLHYNFCDWGFVTLFADYFFQKFHFHDKGYYSAYNSFSHHYEVVERFNLNMNGYKIGVGLGVGF